jgi:glycosyltransferase involved in cell wall biosynthesis
VVRADIVIADSTNRYDGRDLATRPLGGTETSVIHLAEALARQGHAVTAYTRTAEPVVHHGVTWRPLGSPGPETCTLLLAVQQPELLGVARRPQRRALWVVWPARGLGRLHRARRLWRYRPWPVFVSDVQAAAYRWWLPRARHGLVIPFGLPDAVRGHPPLPAAPPPRAIFASNPQRDLRWHTALWAQAILPRVPHAELHIHGIRDYAYRYGEPWEETAAHLGQFLPADLSLAARRSLRPHPPLPQDALWQAMRECRLFLYAGHRVETFCLSAAEAQALGVPAVVKRIGVMPERVRDGVTGFVAEDDEAFARHAVALLTDDALWRRQHAASLRLQQGWTWDEIAARLEAELIAPLLRAHPVAGRAEPVDPSTRASVRRVAGPPAR